MSGIRVTYTGLISFVSGLLSLVFGLIVITLITRTLSPEEFGTWRLIISLIVYVNYIQPIVNYWVTREIARNVESGRTAILTNGLFSCIGIILYLSIAYFVSDQSDADIAILTSAFILIPMVFLQSVLTAINYGWKPHAVSYGTVILEASKIPLLIIFVYWLQMGVSGVIFAIALSYIPSLLILYIFCREKISNKIQIQYIKKWLRLSWLPFYPSIGSVIAALDVLIFTLITSSVLGLAFYGAALIISKLCENAGLISNAVYPKLLEGTQNNIIPHNIIQNNITLIAFFAIPLASISIFFAKPALFALNPIYEDAYPAIIFMTIRTFLFTFSVPFVKFLTGIETVDISSDASFKDYVKSKLFLVPSIRLIQYSVYIILLSLVFLTMSSSSNDIELITYWSIIWLVVEIPFFIYFYIKIKNNFKFKLEIKNLLKYFFSSILVFGIFYYLSLEFLEFKNTLVDFLPNLLLFVGLGIVGYLVLTYLIDEKTKKLFNAILHEIKYKNNK